MIDVNELLEIAIKEAENLMDAEIFLVKRKGVNYNDKN